MKALISPNELVYDYEGTLLGERVAQVQETEFEVAPPLFWTDCPNDCMADQWYYAEGGVHPIPEPPPTE